MKIRRLTSDGIAQFGAFLSNLKAEPTLPVPSHLLSDSSASAAIETDANVDPIDFSSRFEAAKYLYSTLGDQPQIERDAGLWAWLTLFFFDQLCPVGKSGVRKVGELARYLPAVTNFQKYYRHLLLGPFLIYGAHVDNPHRAAGVLTTALQSPGDVVEQLASRQELITNRAVMGVATKLYVDSASGTMKKGSGGKGAGSPRRLADLLNQFDLTFDLYAMQDSQLSQLLPKEFDRFRS